MATFQQLAGKLTTSLLRTYLVEKLSIFHPVIALQTLQGRILTFAYEMKIEALRGYAIVLYTN